MNYNMPPRKRARISRLSSHRDKQKPLGKDREKKSLGFVQDAINDFVGGIEYGTYAGLLIYKNALWCMGDKGVYGFDPAGRGGFQYSGIQYVPLLVSDKKRKTIIVHSSYNLINAKMYYKTAKAVESIITRTVNILTTSVNFNISTNPNKDPLSNLGPDMSEIWIMGYCLNELEESTLGHHVMKPGKQFKKTQRDTLSTAKLIQAYESRLLNENAIKRIHAFRISANSFSRLTKTKDVECLNATIEMWLPIVVRDINEVKLNQVYLKKRLEILKEIKHGRGVA